MTRSVTVERVYACLASAALILVSSCGGGTTGTSPTSELKFAGYVQESNGARLGSTPMLVRSATSDQELLAASTDKRGDFTMSLPGSESAVLIEIEGKRSQPVARRFSGSSVLSTAVTMDSKGELVAAGSFEVYIDSGSLCSNLGTENNELYLQGEISSPCIARLLISSSDFPLATFRADVKAKCGLRILTIQSFTADSNGAISVDLGKVSDNGCETLKIVVSSERDRERVVEVPVS